jgi:cyanophycinase-like exopeptidase
MSAAAQGTVALVGAGEFLPRTEAIDRLLLERLQGTPRVVVLPTASAPDGPGVPERWAKMGVEHFTRLGAAVEPVLLLTRADAESADLAAQIAAANFVYLSGGKPQYLLATLRETACWHAIEDVFHAGGVVAGCSAGAMALGQRMVDFPWLWRTLPALGLAPGLAVIPHFDELPRIFVALGRSATRQVAVAGVPGGTALVGTGHTWTAQGSGTVTLFTRTGQQTYHSGEQVELPL